MKEKEIRERVEQFLKRTARNVVVPASLGLGLSLSGCEGNALRARATDAGLDLADTAITQDLPAMYLVYLVMMPDAAPDTRPVDAESEAGSLRPDAGPDISSPPPPYMVPPSPSEDAMPQPEPPPQPPLDANPARRA
jgi:hypothetical protein